MRSFAEFRGTNEQSNISEVEADPPTLAVDHIIAAEPTKWMAKHRHEKGKVACSCAMTVFDLIVLELAGCVGVIQDQDLKSNFLTRRNLHFQHMDKALENALLSVINRCAILRERNFSESNYESRDVHWRQPRVRRSHLRHPSAGSSKGATLDKSQQSWT